jgi:predicted metal-binding transcription factor (methanogenesis marker protein 9)
MGKECGSPLKPCPILRKFRKIILNSIYFQLLNLIAQDLIHSTAASTRPGVTPYFQGISAQNCAIRNSLFRRTSAN